VVARGDEFADDRPERSRTDDWQREYAASSRNLGKVNRREDALPQDHLAHVAAVKPGPLRLLSLRAVLTAIRLGDPLRKQGQLGGITSIHFARLAITGDPRQLIVHINFDGSWEGYLDEVIDRAAWWLTAVWTNTDNPIGFPRTKVPTFPGARDEARFKAFARYGMAPTPLWFSAYPKLSIKNISNNRAIRTGLIRPDDGDGREAWLRLL